MQPFRISGGPIMVRFVLFVTWQPPNGNLVSIEIVRARGTTKRMALGKRNLIRGLIPNLHVKLVGVFL